MPETLKVRRVVVSAVVENLSDLWNLRDGHLNSTQVRRVEIEESVVDSSTTMFCMPTALIQQLGLMQFGERTLMTNHGRQSTRVFGPAILTVQGRDCTVDIVELPDGMPTVIGHVPLTLLDFVVDSSGRRLIGNPAHNGEQMVEIY